MTSNQNPFQKITNDRSFILDCYIEMLSRINEHEVISLIKSNPQDLIDEQIEARLFEYIGGVCKGLGCNPIKVGGYINAETQRARGYRYTICDVRFEI